MCSPLNSCRSVGMMALAALSFLFLPLLLPAQIQIWGVSKTGGSDNIGSVFNLYDDGSAYTIESDFINTEEGASPRSQLVRAEDGSFYGITSSGGTHNGGTLFRYSDEAGLEVLYNLEPSNEGSNSEGGLVETSPGIFIGTTTSGAQFGAGSLFRYSLADGLSLLRSFNPLIDGGNPTGGLAFDENSEIVYGTCSTGGNNNDGTAYAYNLLNGVFSLMHHFDASMEGALPKGGLTLAQNGMLYGTTQFGGSNSQGSIFRIDPIQDDYTTIYNLNNNSSDGQYPFGKLTESTPGVFMGTCSEGGNSGTGTVFKVTDAGVFTRLHSFQAASDGGFTKTGLAPLNDDLFFGVTEFGGLNGFGTIYTVNEAGSFSKLHDLDFTQDGSNPLGALTADG
ncbi:MAG: hypothetical protein GVX78_05225, partial [Bacteroidetes bacterium]|nr:hypothetical protein [Bacteroidota bacterium]